MTPTPTKHLKPFQFTDSHAMRAAGNSICGSEPGTGKTAIGISLISKRTLIVVPKSVLYQYQSEIQAFLPSVTPVVATGTPMERIVAYKSKPELLLLTYESLRIDIQYIAALPEFETIIFDEVHRLASHTTKTHKAIRALLKFYKSKPRIYGFTASLIMNSPMDCFGVFSILQPELFPSWFHFVNFYMVRTTQGWLVGPRSQNLSHLGDKIRPYLIRRTLAEVAPQLPAHTDEIIKFDLSAKEEALYNQIRKELIFELLPTDVDKLKNVLSIQNALTKLQVLSELTNSPEIIGHSGIPSTKIAMLEEKLAELLTGNDRKCVVFSRFARMINILEPLLKEYNPVVIQGSVTGQQRQDNITKFKTDPACRLMLVTTAGSEGISLEEAQYLIRMDTPFSIGRDIQLTGRIRRITSLEPTFSFTLAARNTVDEKMLKILERKKTINSSIFNTEDIKELLE